MKVEKEALGGQRVEPTEEELALVNRQSRKELTAGRSICSRCGCATTRWTGIWNALPRRTWSGWVSCF